MFSSSKAYRVDFLDRPGTTLSDERLRELNRELKAVGIASDEGADDDSCARCARRELADRVFTLLRRGDGRLDGFASATLLPVDSLGTVLHLGPIRVRPGSADAGWTEILVARLALGVLVRRCPWSRIWVSSLANRMSVLGVVASQFESVYPSPLSSVVPRQEHLRIARAIDRQHRGRILLPAEARFDESAFVFRGGAGPRPSSNAHPTRRPDRAHDVFTRFYAGRISADPGDEVLQVGFASLATALRSWAGRRRTLPGLGDGDRPRSGGALRPLAVPS